MKDVLYKKKCIQANNEDENIYSILKEEYTRYRTIYGAVLERPRKFTTQELLIFTRMP